MARQKRSKKIRMPKALEGAKEFILPRIAAIIVPIIFIVLAWLLAKAFLERSDYFRIRSVEAKGASEAGLALIRSDLLRYYKDKNIFKTDLKIIAKGLEPRYPDAKGIIVKRALPDKLVVELIFRSPVALLSDGQYYPVDRDGVVLVNIAEMKLKGLPVIKGVDVRQAGKSHKRIESRNLMLALDLVDEIKRAKFLEKFNVRLISAGDIKNLSFYLGDSGPEVIIGYENFRERLNLLRNTLKDQKLILDRISYIDIRFRDVAIGPK